MKKSGREELQYKERELREGVMKCEEWRGKVDKLGRTFEERCRKVRKCEE